MPLTLRLITPSRQLVDAQVDEVVAPGSAGEFGVLPEHVNFVGELEAGILTYSVRGAKKKVVVHGGYAEVVDDVVTVLADGAERPEEIDVAVARGELQRVERELSAESESSARIEELLRERRLEEIRIAAAGA
jgi:F-type H+-transporting ATPase subunit epsilon